MNLWLAWFACLIVNNLKRFPRFRSPAVILQLLLMEVLSKEGRSASLRRADTRFWSMHRGFREQMPINALSSSVTTAIFCTDESERDDRYACMERYAIRLLEDDQTSCCPMCGQTHPEGKGLRLFVEEQQQPLCRDCGKKLAPTMVALLDLANTAERVGRSCRHLLTPPMESLLDLARAAENYAGVNA